MKCNAFSLWMPVCVVSTKGAVLRKVVKLTPAKNVVAFISGRFLWCGGGKVGAFEIRGLRGDRLIVRAN